MSLSSPISSGSPDRSCSPLIEKLKHQCARCGSCTVVCPVFRVTGRETLVARGKLHLLASELSQDPSEHFQDIFAQCLLCGACEENCSRQLPIRDQIVEARSSFSALYGKHPLQRVLAREILSRPSLLEGLIKAGLSLSRLSLLPEESGLRIKLGLLEKKQVPQSVDRETRETDSTPDSDGISYFSGCVARYLQPSIGEATTSLAQTLTGMPLQEPDLQRCCGLAAWSAGKVDEARKLAKRNIETFAGVSGQILTSCASCSAHLQKYPSLFEGDPEWQERATQFSDRVKELTSFVADNMLGRKLSAESPARVYYHEPCHLRFDKECQGVAGQLIETIDNVELVNANEGSQCCGQGGLFHLGYPELSDAIFSQGYDKYNWADVDVATTSCSGCLMQWQAELARRHCHTKVMHIALWLKSHMKIKG